MHWRCGFLKAHKMDSQDPVGRFHTPQSWKTRCPKIIARIGILSSFRTSSALFNFRLLEQVPGVSGSVAFWKCWGHCCSCLNHEPRSDSARFLFFASENVSCLVLGFCFFFFSEQNGFEFRFEILYLELTDNITWKQPVAKWTLDLKRVHWVNAWKKVA